MPSVNTPVILFVFQYIKNCCSIATNFSVQEVELDFTFSKITLSAMKTLEDMFISGGVTFGNNFCGSCDTRKYFWRQVAKCNIRFHLPFSGAINFLL